MNKDDMCDVKTQGAKTVPEHESGAEEFSEKIYDENAAPLADFDQKHSMSATGGDLRQTKSEGKDSERKVSD
jgi:hypothetical protein